MKYESDQDMDASQRDTKFEKCDFFVKGKLEVSDGDHVVTQGRVVKLYFDPGRTLSEKESAISKRIRAGL